MLSRVLWCYNAGKYPSLKRVWKVRVLKGYGVKRVRVRAMVRGFFVGFYEIAHI